MSSIEFMENLLYGVDVGWRPLGSLCQIETGKLNANASIENGEFMFFTTAKEISRIDKYRWDTEALLIAGNANVGEVKHYIGKFDAYQRTYVLTNFSASINVRFLFFVLSNNLKKYLEEKTNSAAMTYIVLPTLVNFQIPIPCPENPKKSLEIQAEIVRILDAFTAHAAELTAELTARKKQYNYYRDQLLTFKEDIPKVQLLECCASISDGDHQAPPKADVGIPFVTISNISDLRELDFTNTKFVPEAYYDGLHDKRKARKNDILYTVVGSFGIPVHIDSDQKFAFQRHIAILRPNGNLVISKYLYHVFLSSEFLKQANTVATGAAQKTITLSALNKMKVPLPSLIDQARIVAILDKFEALTSSISEGLPREIALREQQYEYYRDQLLSFPKSEVA